ncbi:DUF2927 domain-containing protein [Oryzibacter oryziterrae]|uniref:DUF2927 domain-containing protein n=1 Tax=Oryzibacter oryziterrae TaxID=2766474 RepID=UPI001F358261|nr:DUF2927 domain-containing protein [Oryzibacter oryziterrae]
MQAAFLVLLVSLTSLIPARAGDLSAFTDAQLIAGFRKTVFGAEFGSAQYERIVKKFAGPVRMRVVDYSGTNRHRQISAFVASLHSKVDGLDIRIVNSKARANFTLYVVDRASYLATVQSNVLGLHSGAAPGQCLVRLVPSASSIGSSTAVIVADEGESEFRRCMVEEILQGLGPMNDNSSLTYSVFNDSSKHADFMPFDRAIVSMLYDRRIRPGMNVREAEAVLPDVIADVRKRIR